MAANNQRSFADRLVGVLMPLCFVLAVVTLTAKGGSWYAGTVRYVLHNGFYAGLSQWDGVEVKGTHDAIISRELYERAHTRLKSIKPGPMAV